MSIRGYRADIWILISVIALIVFSIGAVYSASSYYSLVTSGSAEGIAKWHLLKVALAIVMIFVMAKIDYNLYSKYSKYILWFAILMLLFVLLGVASKKNVNRWIQLGPLSFQPSDFAKFALIIHISYLLMKKKDYVQMLYKGYLPLLGYIAIVTALVAAQPNFSTAMIIFGSSMLLLFIANVKIKHLLFTIAGTIPVAVAFILSRGYIMNRIENYANSGGTDPSTKMQLTQALIGLGNGGFFGVGPGNSFQKELFLPEAYGDFIFAIVGEEYGFIGTFLILAVFIFICYRGYRIARQTTDEFGKYLAFGITTIIASYAVVNMCVATGIIPTTGVPVPFISHGGTALIINSMSIGILLNISSQRETSKEVNA
jgi:cell division protein FtsW